jgi:tetratricopeptide (TPR) repeat protein
MPVFKRINTVRTDSVHIQVTAHRNETGMPRYLVQFCIITTILCTPLQNALAVQWQALSGTARYKVAYDEQSVRLTPLGRLEVWLRFIPRGEAERKLAASEYKEKRYRSHLEYYEIDCSEQAALLGLIDILGTSRARVKRLEGGKQPYPIPPGSMLDSVAQRICTALDKETDDDDEAVEPEPVHEPDSADVQSLGSDALQKIESLKNKTASKDATADTWKELGNIYFDNDRPEQAIKAYERALSLRPNDADTLNDQGAMYRQTGDFVRAVANFEKAVALDPNNLESLYNGAYVYAFDLNDIPKALILWRRYLELESKSETALQVRSFIEKHGK